MGRFTLMVAMIASALVANINTANAECFAIAGQGGDRHFPAFSTNGYKVMFLHDTEKRTIFITNRGNTPLYKCLPRLQYDNSKLKCKTTKVRKNYSNGVRASGWHVSCEARKGLLRHRGLKLAIVTMVNTIRVTIDVYRKLKYLLAKVREIRDGLDVRIKANTKRSLANEERSLNNTDSVNDAKDTASTALTIAKKAKIRKSANMEFGMGIFNTFYHQGVNLVDGQNDDRRFPSWGIALSYTWWAYNWVNGNHKISVGPSTRLNWHTFVLTIRGTPPDDDVLANQYEAIADLTVRYKFGKFVSCELFGGAGLGLLHHSDQTSDPNTMDGVNQNVSAQFLLHGGFSLNLHLWRFVLSMNVRGTWTRKGLYHPDYINDVPYFSNVGQGFMGISARYAL